MLLTLKQGRLNCTPFPLTSLVDKGCGFVLFFHFLKFGLFLLFADLTFLTLLEPDVAFKLMIGIIFFRKCFVLLNSLPVFHNIYLLPLGHM